MKWMIAILAVTAVAGCGGKRTVTTTTTTTTTTVAAAETTACLNDTQKGLVGAPFAQSRPLLPADVRVIPPNSLYSQDFVPNRVNVAVTENYTITRIWCG